MKGKWTVTPRAGVEVSQEKLDEIASKLNDGRWTHSMAQALSGAFQWDEQPEGSDYWAEVDGLVAIEYVTEPEQASNVLEKIEALPDDAEIVAYDSRGSQLDRLADGEGLKQLVTDYRAQTKIISQLRQEAEIQAQEMRSHRATVRDIYQLVTGATGEPGDWNGAEPIRAKIAELTERAEKAERRVAELMN